MSRPLRIQYPDAFYHVTCRGNERREIFRHADDRKEFFRLLSRSLTIFEVQLLAYAMMPNHFHLLVCTPKGNLSEFMRHFNISYTGFFNRKHKRTGHLYQGRYKAFLIDENNYLMEVSRYIHLNPLRIKSQKPVGQRFRDLMINDSTSFPGYLQPQNRKSFVQYKIILDYFGGENHNAMNEYQKFVVEGMERDRPVRWRRERVLVLLEARILSNKFRRHSAKARGISVLPGSSLRLESWENRLNPII